MLFCDSEEVENPHDAEHGDQQDQAATEDHGKSSEDDAVDIHDLDNLHGFRLESVPHLEDVGLGECGVMNSTTSTERPNLEVARLGTVMYFGQDES